MESQSSNTEGGMLRKLLTKIYTDLNITPTRFHVLLQHYLEDPLNGVPQNSRSISSERSNTVKELKKPQISWKQFLRGMKIVRANRFTITITVHHSKDVKTEHSIEVDLGRNYISGEGHIEDD